jgi:hypothetical protein
MVSSCPIDKNECIAIATNQNTVSTEGDVNMTSIKVMIQSLVERFTMVAFRDGGKRSKRRRKLAAVNPGAISTDLDQLPIIAKFSASHHAMEFLGGPIVLVLDKLVVSHGLTNGRTAPL